MAKIFFPQYEKGKKGLKIVTGLSILDHIRKLNLEIASECGGRGVCGRCVIRVEKGDGCLNEKTGAEKKFSLEESERLACQAKIIKEEKDIYIFLRDFGKYQILIEKKERSIELDPFVRNRGGRVFYDGENLGPYRGKIYGLAIDVGTTTVVLEVVNLETAKTIATMPMKNPQISYGNDVISRIDYILVNKKEIRYNTPDERTKRLKELQRAIIEGINETLKNLERKTTENLRDYIYDVVIVGNPTMRNIFFGIDISSLGLIPYEPLKKEPIIKKAADIGLDINPQANVYATPLIGGHVGADTLANILTTEIYKSDKPNMIIDIGTNGEVIIGNKRKILACSCAAGGAYEGASVRCGSGAIEGAIMKIRLKDDKVQYETIGNNPPIGICGSGLIDLLAELLNANILSPTAKLKDEFFITDKISINQTDVYQLVTTKAGFKTGQDLMIKYYGISLTDLDKIFVAGAFGNYINPNNAITIGLLPKAKEKIVKIGNGALEGAREMLISRKKRKEAEEIVKKIEHIKPNEREDDFAYLVAKNMYFEEA